MFNLNVFLTTLLIALGCLAILALARWILAGSKKKRYGMTVVLDDGTEQPQRRRYATLDEAQNAAQVEQRSLYADGQLGRRVMPTKNGSVEEAIKERGSALPLKVVPNKKGSDRSAQA